MKKVFLIILTLAFIAGCGKPFEETYSKSIEDLKSKKSQAISYDEFYNKYFKDKNELQLKAQKEEWGKNNSWPIISFNYEISLIKGIEMGGPNKTIDNNKDKFAYISINVDPVLSILGSKRKIILYTLKKDAIALKEGQKLKGYGQSYDFSYDYPTFYIKLYPIIIE